MPDLRVRGIETRTSQPAGQPWPVTVALNNLETVAFHWEEGVCNEGGEYGHKADVTLTVRNSGGGEVWSEERRVCIPRNRVGQMMGANLRETFRPEVAQPGTYTVTAHVEAAVGSGSDTSDPERVDVTTADNTEPADDGASGGMWGDWDGDGPAEPGDSGNPFELPTGGNFDAIFWVIVLALVAWLASSGSNTVEALT